MWQPCAGWQIFTPEVPYGAHKRLQQSPHPVHTVPSTPPLQKVAPAGGAPQTPRVPPAEIVHTPPQQSAACAHTSSSWTQNDDAIEQCPPVQSCEQHSELCAHEFPDVLHVVASALQVPASQAPLQHSALETHATPSEVHACAVHCPPSHEREQQSRAVAQGAPEASQFVGAPERQVSVRGSQRSEQQSTSAPQ
jgi:hypothetical protein